METNTSLAINFIYSKVYEKENGTLASDVCLREASNLAVSPIRDSASQLALKLVSYDNSVAVRRKCRPDECGQPGEHPCPNLSMCSTSNQILGVKFIVSSADIPSRRINNARQANAMRKHIELLLELLQTATEWTPILERAGFDLHPSKVCPIVQIVDCWADEVPI